MSDFIFENNLRMDYNYWGVLNCEVTYTEYSKCTLNQFFYRNDISRTQIDISHKLIYPHTHPQTSVILFVLYSGINRKVLIFFALQ